MSERLYRSVDDRVVAGVCGGLAVRLAVDPSLVRIAVAVVALLTGIFPLVVLYVIMAVVVPEEPTGFAGRPAAPRGPGAVPGWISPGGREGAMPWTDVPADATAPAPDAAAGGWSAPGSAAAPEAGPSSWPAPPPGQSSMPPADRRRSSDATLGVVAGVVLVALGLYFLVRDRIAVDWGVVWAAGLVALGAVIVIAAFRPRR